MYHFVDRPVERLCNSGRMLLWAMRAWNRAQARGQCPPGALTRVFGGVDALAALPDFHVAMALLHKDMLAAMPIAELGRHTIAEGEAILLALWRDAACGNMARLRATLALVVEKHTVASAATAMTAAAPRFAAAGFDLTGLSPQVLKETK